MIIHIGDGLDEYCVKLIMVQDKEADTPIDRHEGKISCAVIVNYSADFIGKGTKTK